MISAYIATESWLSRMISAYIATDSWLSRMISAYIATDSWLSRMISAYIATDSWLSRMISADTDKRIIYNDNFRMTSTDTTANCLEWYLLIQQLNILNKILPIPLLIADYPDWKSQLIKNEAWTLLIKENLLTCIPVFYNISLTTVQSVRRSVLWRHRSKSGGPKNTPTAVLYLFFTIDINQFTFYTLITGLCLDCVNGFCQNHFNVKNVKHLCKWLINKLTSLD